jgi:hypothetical protein
MMHDPCTGQPLTWGDPNFPCAPGDVDVPICYRVPPDTVAIPGFKRITLLADCTATGSVLLTDALAPAPPGAEETGCCADGGCGGGGGGGGGGGSGFTCADLAALPVVVPAPADTVVGVQGGACVSFTVESLTGGGGGDSSTFTLIDTQTFSANGTWTKPVSPLIPVFFIVDVIGGGGGGGGGEGRAINTTRQGGAGGAGGARNRFTFFAADLAATEAVIVGAGGAGSAGGSPGAGVSGLTGGFSAFGTLMRAFGGGGGAGGNAPLGNISGPGGGGGLISEGQLGQPNSDTPGGLPGPNAPIVNSGYGGAGSRSPAAYGGAGGGNGATFDGATGPGYISVFGGSGGGGGGNVTSGNNENAGNVGGGSLASPSGAGGGGAAGTIGAPGGAGAAGNSSESGRGGGGGGSNNVGPGAVGGAGGFPGGGGGGGGGGTAVGGLGGNGGGGQVRVYTFGLLPGGGGGLVFPLLPPNGTCAAPTYSFATEPDCGMFFDSAVGVGGSVRIGWNNCDAFISVGAIVRMEGANGDFFQVGASAEMFVGGTTQVHLSSAPILGRGVSNLFALYTALDGRAALLDGGFATATMSGGDGWVRGGDSSFAQNAGNAVLDAGDANVAGSIAGSAVIAGGRAVAGATLGEIIFRTNALERARITGAGEWSIGGSIGVAGQVITSNGPGNAPTWQSAVPAPDNAAQVVWACNNIGPGADNRVMPVGYDNGLISTAPIRGYMAPRAGTFRNLFVRYNAAAGNGSPAVFTLRVNGVATSLSVSRATGTIGSASNLVNTVAVAQGDLIEMTVGKGASIANGILEVFVSAEFA